jgi:hypothetical protein
VKILDRLPYWKKHSTLIVGKETVPVKSYQIVISVSLSQAKLQEWDPTIPAFPAILDIGTNHNFVISQSQLARWVGIKPQFLRVVGAARLDGKRLSTYEADVWLHSNLKGRLENRRDRPPFRLSLSEGIIILPDEEHRGIRLSLLGLRALTNNKLVTIIDGARRQITIQTAWKSWWPW